MPLALADVQQFETEIEIDIDGDDFIITTEESSYNYHCGGTANYDLDIDFLRNVTCDAEEYCYETQSILRTISGGLNDSRKYYDKYLECYGEYTKCNERLGQGNVSNGYQDKWVEALSNYETCKGQKASLTTQKQSAESSLSTCETEREESKNSVWVYAIVGLIVGILGYKWFTDRDKKPAVSSAEDQLPKSR